MSLEGAVADDVERQLVVFELAGASYGVAIETVHEIIRMQAVTHVPETSDFVEGVINLRGHVIPVVDLRKRFRLAAAAQSAESRIVVVDINGVDLGVIVGAVTEVLRVASNAIEPTSPLIVTEDSHDVDGIAKVGDRLLILLDLGRALAATMGPRDGAVLAAS